MDHGTPWHLLTRHFSGVASAAEEAELEQWIGADPERERFVRMLQEGWDAPGSLPERHDSSAGWARVAARIARRGRSFALAGALAPQERRLGRIYRLVRIAAVLLAAVGLAIVARRPFADLLAGFTRRPPAQPPAFAMRETTTQRGQRATVLLPDGSRVTLGAASTLKYPLVFTGSARQSSEPYRRDLYLEGEAYFEVTRDTLHPFVVHTRGAETRVLGTKFVVRADRGDSVVEVAVREGRVALRGAPESVGATQDSSLRVALLERGEVGRLVRGGDPAVVVGADVERYLGWTAGRLVFRDTPLRDVVAELARWYDLDVTFAPGTESVLTPRRFTGTFMGQRADEVLTFLALSSDVRVRRHGRAIVLSPK